MYEDALDKKDKLLRGENDLSSLNGGVLSVLGTLPDDFATTQGMPRQMSTVFVTTSHSTSTTTTLTASGGMKKTTSQVVSARTVRVQNTNLGTLSTCASSCKDLLQCLSSSSSNGVDVKRAVSCLTSPDEADALSLPAMSSASLVNDCASATDSRQQRTVMKRDSPCSPRTPHGGFAPFQTSLTTRKETPSDEDRAIEEALNQTLVTFSGLLEKHRQMFMKAFPMFVNERTKPKVTTETIVQPDGSILVIEKEESRQVLQLSRRTTIVNGVVQSSTTKAVMVYGGPEHGYELRMEHENEDDKDDNDEMNRDDKWDDNEDDDDEDDWRRGELSLVSGDDSESQFSAENFPLATEDGAGKNRKRQEKAWGAASELVDTERRYVAKLELLENVFRQRVLSLKDKTISNDKMTRLFSNVGSLLLFHKEHLLPQLESRLREWKHAQQISDVLCKLAPYLKMYSEYTNNYKKACKTFDELRQKNKRFSVLIKEVENLPECDNLPLQSHLICPVQRIARYHLLLKEYLKNLPDNHVDRKDAELALEKVKVAASHANDMMKKLDKYKDVIEIQESLGSQMQGLVTPSRELVKKGRLIKISSKTGDQQERILFLFNDILLLCSERSLTLAKYKLRAIINVDRMQLLEGDNLELDFTFQIRSRERRIHLQAKNGADKLDWMDTLWNCIQNYKSNKESFSRVSPVRENVENGSDTGTQVMTDTSCSDSALSSNKCIKCKSSFKFLNKEISCHMCQTLGCKKCVKKIFPATTQSTSEAKDKILACAHCAENMHNSEYDTITSRHSLSLKRRRCVNGVKPGDNCILEGYLDLRNAKSSQWLNRYFALHSDFVLYCFRNANDDDVKSSLLLPGCVVSFVDAKADAAVLSKLSSNLIFKLVQHRTTYYFRGTNENDTVKWMAALDLASQAELPIKLPTHSS